MSQHHQSLNDKVALFQQKSNNWIFALVFHKICHRTLQKKRDEKILYSSIEKIECQKSFDHSKSVVIFQPFSIEIWQKIEGWEKQRNFSADLIILFYIPKYLTNAFLVSFQDLRRVMCYVRMTSYVHPCSPASYVEKNYGVLVEFGTAAKCSPLNLYDRKHHKLALLFFRHSAALRIPV